MPSPAATQKGPNPKSQNSSGGGGGGGKPLLRNLHQMQTMKNIYTALALAGTAGALFYVLVARKRRNAYAEFHSKYDADESFQRMVDAGVLDSAPPPKKK